MISNNTQQQWEHLCFLFRMDDEIGFDNFFLIFFMRK